MRQKKEKYINAVILCLVPIVGAILYCAFQGHSISALFLPDSNWNDELVYYKMTEAILDFGYPKGFFGFNESHAQILSFAAWSPVILLQWVLWGLFFGWTYFSPYLSNVLTMAVCLFAFGLMVRPTKKQTLWIALMLLAFKPISRYNLSCVPEPEMFSLLILYLGLCIHVGRDEKTGYPVKRLCALYFIVALMTLIRPYMILMFLAPSVLWMWSLKKNGKKKTVTVLIPLLSLLGISLVVLLCYMMIGKYLSAPYLEPLFSTAWLDGFRTKGFAGGLRNMLSIVKKSLVEMYGLIKAVLVKNTYFAAGLYYLHIFAALLFGAIFFVKDFWSIYRKKTEDPAEKTDSLLLFQIVLAGAAFLAADVLMYRIEPGGRHTLVFILGILLLFAVRSKTDSAKLKISPAAVILGVTILLYVFFGNVSYEYDLPYDSGNRKAEFVKLSKTLEETIQLTQDRPSFENTVIWTFGVENTAFAEYYALPSGSGINLVEQDVVMRDPNLLKSRYIGTVKGSCTDIALQEAGFEFCGGTEGIVFYKKQ